MVVFAAVVVVLLGVLIFNPSSECERNELTVINSSGEEITVYVELALDDHQHSKGLSGRESLCYDCGMLFVFEENVSTSFWMKDTSIPLSIAFISENGTIIDIQDMEPYSLESHSPGVEYRYALEVNIGFFEDNEISVGDRVLISEF